MRVHTIFGPPPETLHFTNFEKQFFYPLGPGRSFYIEHSQDYPLFFKSMGEGCCFVAEQENQVLGTLGVSYRPIFFPDGSTQNVLYVGDLKIVPRARSGSVLWRLFKALKIWAEDKKGPIFGVVMDGTLKTPLAYTGRMGLPLLDKIASISILKISTKAAASRDFFRDNEAPFEQYQDLLRQQQERGYACGSSKSELRSEREAIWLVDPEGKACGMLEDTRKCKRLFEDQGTEIKSAHLSYFAFTCPERGWALIEEALTQCKTWDYPSLFVAVPIIPEPWGKRIQESETVVATATVFGSGFEKNYPWLMNTSEI